MRAYLARTATATAALIDGDEFVRFTRPEQDTTDEYRRASRPLRVLLESNPDIRFAYSGATTGAKMHFVLDGTPVDARDSAGRAEHARPMEEDAASPGEIEVMRTQRVTLEQEPSATAWGMGIRAQAPIFASGGRMVGYVGITMQADRYRYLIHRTDTAAIFGALLVTGLSLITGLGIWRTQRAYADAERARRHSELQLREERDRLRAYAEALDRTDDEARRATAADLQSGVGQIIAGQSMILRAAHAEHSPTAIHGLVEQALEAGRAAQDGVQNLIQDVSPPELEQATLPEILAWLAKLFHARHGFQVDWQFTGDADFPREQRRLIYRIVRELIQNALRHSGSAEVHVKVAATDRTVVIEVVDDGVGFDPDSLPNPPTGSFGLAHLCERARAAGGSLEVASAPAEGCRVTVALPVVRCRSRDGRR